MPNEDEWMDAEMDAENMTGRSSARTPEEGIKIMEERLRVLRAREGNIRTGDQFTDETLREKSLIEIGREIRDAQSQLKHYKMQLEGRN